MKHFFIVNPAAGKTGSYKDALTKIHDESKKHSIIYDIHITKDKDDARDFVRQVCENDDDVLHFYACGGDGTLNEVANGCIGYKNASVGVVPYGTGNDFIKNFSNTANFSDISEQIHSAPLPIDVIKINNRYAINVINIGFDATIAHHMTKFKQLPYVSGSTAYSMALVYCLTKKLGNHLKLTLDDDSVINNNMLLAVIANGHCYGGDYKCAPLAEINDGLIDICCVKKVSRFKIANFVKYYKEGTHLSQAKLKESITYKKCNKISVSSPNPFIASIDGEIIHVHSLHCEVIKSGLNFLVPTSCKITSPIT
ncbi:MAG: lipid kinase [Oscillospiraceae bacterium]|nr:lipid kinase [Oscillospiraceae bacterium]